MGIHRIHIFILGLVKRYKQIHCSTLYSSRNISLCTYIRICNHDVIIQISPYFLRLVHCCAAVHIVAVSISCTVLSIYPGDLIQNIFYLYNISSLLPTYRPGVVVHISTARCLQHTTWNKLLLRFQTYLINTPIEIVQLGSNESK